MEAYSNAHHAHTRTSHLTKLYSDAKKSALINIEVQPNTTYQFSALHRKYRIQKDRLITWGLAWSDDERGPDGNIDESVARAGLTETVDSVLRNIKEVTDEAERIKAASVPGLATKGGDHKLAQPFDEARYEDLLRDLTTSIDTLYDLSRSRKALARGEHPTFSTIPEEKIDEKPTSSISASLRKKLFRSGSYASSETTLVNPPPFSRPSLSPYAGLPPRIDASALRLPEEGPPPYESIGVPSMTRLVGRLVRNKASETIQNATGSSAAEIPVLVEYANFDSTYRDTGVPPPLQRLESLANFFQPMRPESQNNLSLLGYFEDLQEPRIGLVYDLPYAIQNRLQGTSEKSAQTLAPISLLKLVQKSNKPQKPINEVIVPSLEDRFCMALRLVEQLHEFHARQIAHGNINSSSIIFTTTDNESSSSRNKQLRSPLWSAFDLFSKCSVEGVTRAINLNIYRHPEDHPQSPGRSTSVDIKFDMYGLAVILLEIGLWTPIGELYKTKYTLADFKLRLEKLWIPKLASKCGSAYMRAVQACIAAADDLDLSDSMPIIESAYELLLQNLRRCCLLDEGATIEPVSGLDFPPPEAASVLVPSKVKRKPVPIENVLPPKSASMPKLLLRTRSEPINDGVSTPPNPQATLSGPFNPDELSRQPSILRTISREDTLTSLSQTSTSNPSFKQYKQSVMLIQRTWREHRARRLVEETSRAEEHQRLLAETEQDNEKRPRPKKKEFPHLPISQSVMEDWHNRTSAQIARIVEKALKGSLESSSISLTAYGETQESARPTYLVCCTSTTRVKHALKRHFRFDASMCDVRVKKDEVRRCRRSRRDRPISEARRTMAPGYGSMEDSWTRAVNPDYQEKPLCGASIGAFRDDEHLPPVSFGGIVVVDGVSYGMSVHHMLEAEEDEDEESNPDEDNDSDTSSIRSFDNLSDAESDDDSTVRPPSTVPELIEATDSHEGDCPGIVPGDYEEIAITQPALDDAIDLDLHVDEDEDDSDSGVDEDHLLSYKLGQVHASSGLKRTATSLEGGFKSISQSMPQEIDWALFELVPPRAHPYNIIRGGTRYCKALKTQGRDTCPVAIKESSALACSKVHCLGRTSGLGSGTISTSMDLVKIHGRDTFSASWSVDGDFGVGGDSGAWVISNDDGKVCGHVVASRRGRTYICPMELLLEDIKATLGATEVSLPAVVSAEDGERTQEQALRDAVRSMHLAESEHGGVPLAGNPMRPNASHRHYARAVGVAG